MIKQLFRSGIASAARLEKFKETMKLTVLERNELLCFVNRIEVYEGERIYVEFRVRQTAWERCHTAWSIASSLGAESIVFHSDWKPAPYGFGFWLENVSGFWRDFLEAHQGLRIYVENVYDAGWEGLAALADRVPGLGLCFDAGHAHACSPLPMEERIRGLGSRIGHVHLHNNSGVRDEHRGFFSVPEGGLDMEGLAELLETHLPGADLVLELPRPEELAASLEWAMNRLPPE